MSQAHKPSAHDQTRESAPPSASAAGPMTPSVPERAFAAGWISLIAFMSSAPLGCSIRHGKLSSYHSVPISPRAAPAHLARRACRSFRFQFRNKSSTLLGRALGASLFAICGSGRKKTLRRPEHLFADYARAKIPTPEVGPNRLVLRKRAPAQWKAAGGLGCTEGRREIEL